MPKFRLDRVGPTGIGRRYRLAAWALALLLIPGLLLAADPSNLSGKGEGGLGEAMDEIVQDAVKEPIIPDSAKNTAKKNTSPTPEEMCGRIGAKLRSISRENCLEHELRPSGGLSVNGLPILIREYPPLPARPPQARVLLLGGIHGDEYSSVSIVFKWMEILNAHHSGLFHWRVAPLVNPDGLLKDPAQRTNAHGVDLNRNFPTNDWHKESREYWVKKTGSDPRRFPGPAPLSEPESRWIAEEIERFRPHVIVAIHAPFGLLDFDGPPSTPPERLGALYLTLLGTYPGSLGRYAGIQKKMPIITIELPFAGIMPSPTEVSTIWADMVQWIRGNVRDKKTRTPS